MASGPEGFVCPVCYAEHANQAALMQCYEQHQASEDTSLWSKAKKVAASTAKRYLSKDGGVDGAAKGPSDAIANVATQMRRVVFEEQELGVSNRWTPRFRALRKGRTDKSDIKRNQLLLRLEKLLYKGPTTIGVVGKAANAVTVGMVGKAAAKARKDYERSVVSWTDDTLVPMCPGCGKNFGLLRRRHHCRLCGGVLCGECSLGIELDLALQMLATKEGSRDPAHARKGLKVASDYQFRVCDYCFSGLQSALEVKKSAKSRDTRGKPVPMVALHDILLRELGAVQEMLPTYTNVAFNILKHEQLDRYDWAVGERQRISKKFEAIDVGSKRMLALNQSKNTDPKKQQSSSFRIQKAVRKRFQEYLAQHMLTLVNLPDAKEVQSWRRSAEQERNRRAALDEERIVAEQRKGQALRKHAHPNPGTQAPAGGMVLQHQNPTFSVTGNGGDGGGDGGGYGQRRGDRESSGAPREDSAGGVRRGGLDRIEPVPSGATREGSEEHRGKGGGWNSNRNGEVSDVQRVTSYVDQQAPDEDVDPEQLRGETRVKLRRYLKQAQREGKLDEVEMLQQQIQELDDF